MCKSKMVAIVVHAAAATKAHEVSIEATPRDAPHISSAKDFLLAHPFGVYTCARAVLSLKEDTVCFPYKLVLWPFHLDRLCCGLQSTTVPGNIDDLLLTVLRDATTSLVAQAMRKACGEHESPTGDAMVTVLWTIPDEDVATGGVQINVHICPMPQVR